MTGLRQNARKNVGCRCNFGTFALAADPPERGKLIFGPPAENTRNRPHAVLDVRAERNDRMIGDRTRALARMLLDEGYVTEQKEAVIAAAEILMLAEQMERAQRSGQVSPPDPAAAPTG